MSPRGSRRLAFAAWMAELDEAEKILQDGLATSDDASLHQSLTQVYLAMADRVDANDLRELGEASGAAGQGAASDAGRSRGGQSAGDVRALFGTAGACGASSTAGPSGSRAVARNRAPVGGGNGGRRRPLGTGGLHLEQAYRLDSRLPALLNHLAWALTQGETPDLERALRLADEAVKLAADQPQMRAVRGRILARLQRWQDALTDLEAVLADSEEPDGLHAVLAEVYTALGDTEMAERHQRLAPRGER